MGNLDLGKVVGSKIHHVEGEPEASLGLVNDWALNTKDGSVWEKTEEGWVDRGNFKGEKGDPGQDGKDGENGQDGAPGKDGKDGADGKTPTLSINEEGHLIATFGEE